MREIFRQKLIEKNLLVGEETGNSDYIEANYLLYNKCNVIVEDGYKNVTLDNVKEIEKALGVNTAEPFYRNFPNSVKEMSDLELFADQVLHYIGLADKSVFEQEMGEKVAVDVKKCIATKKVFNCITEKQAVKELDNIVQAMLSASRPLSNDDFDFIADAINEYDFEVANVKSKTNLVKILNYVEKNNLTYVYNNLVKTLKMSDMYKVVECILLERCYRADMKRLKLANQEVKLIRKLMNVISDNGNIDILNCLEKRQFFIGLTSYIHVGKKYDSKKLIKFAEEIRDKSNRSVYSTFKKFLSENPIKAVKYLAKYKGVTVILRNLKFIIDNCKTLKEAEDVVELTFNNINNGLVVIQFIKGIEKIFYGGVKTYKYTKNNMVTSYTKDGEQKPCKYAKEISTFCVQQGVKALKRIYKGSFNNVYIGVGCDKIALPLNTSASGRSVNYLPTGSRIKFDRSKVIRIFTSWKKVDDIDISATAYGYDGNEKEFAWNSGANSYRDKGIVFSGDETNGYKGGVEYFDIEVDKVKKKYKYILLKSNIYSYGTFFNDCDAYSGYMIREQLGGNGPGARMCFVKEIYDIKTVSQRYKVSGNCKMNYTLAIDLENSEIIWLNIASSSMARVGSLANSNFINDIIKDTELFNFETFAQICANKVVKDISKADVIFTANNNYVTPNKNAKVIRPCDYEEILKILK